MMYLRIQKSHVFHQLIVIPFLKTSTTFDLPWILWRSNGLIDHHFWMINSLAILVHFIYPDLHHAVYFTRHFVDVIVSISVSFSPSCTYSSLLICFCSLSSLVKVTVNRLGMRSLRNSSFWLSIGRRIDICVFVSSSCKYSSLFHPSVRTSHSHSFQCDTGCTLVILHVHKSEFSCSAHWFGQKFMKLRNCI